MKYIVAIASLFVLFSCKDNKYECDCSVSIVTYIPGTEIIQNSSSSNYYFDDWKKDCKDISSKDFPTYMQETFNENTEIICK